MTTESAETGYRDLKILYYENDEEKRRRERGRERETEGGQDTQQKRRLSETRTIDEQKSKNKGENIGSKRNKLSSTDFS